MGPDKSPYKPPKSNVESLPTGSTNVIPAGKWLRIFNFIVDLYVGMVILGFLAIFAIGFLFGEEGLRYIETIPDFVFGITLWLLYFLPQESLTSQTLGKLVTGTKVVTEEGLKPSFGQILGRTFSRLVPFEPFSFLGKEGRGWHDKWPKTYVVKCR